MGAKLGQGDYGPKTLFGGHDRHLHAPADSSLVARAAIGSGTRNGNLQ